MKRLGKHLAIWGLILQLAPLPGMVMMARDMMREFDLMMDPANLPDMQQMMDALQPSLHYAMIGTAVALAGVVFLLASLFVCRYRAAWFYQILFALAVLALFAFPVGTIMGVLLIFYLKNRRSEFYPAEVPAAAFPSDPSPPPPAGGHES